MGLIAITNPSDESAEAGIIEQQADFGNLSPSAILEKYGSKIEDGALVVMVNNGRVWQYIATRESGPDSSVALRANNGLAAHEDDDRELSFIEFVAGGYAHGEHIASVARVELETPVELETFTVFGNNDDSEDFVAVVAATEDTVYEEGKKAGVVDEGFEDSVDSVDIVFVLKGDHSAAEAVNV